MVRVVSWCLAPLFAFSLSAPAWAQVPGPVVELVDGPVVAPANVIGMGGAHIAIAEGAGDLLVNPAAASNRSRYSRGDWFAWDWTLDTFAGGRGIDIDFQNNARAKPAADRFSVVTGGLNMTFGRFGAGLSVRARQLILDVGSPLCTDCGQELSFDTFELGMGVAYAWFDGQGHIGVSLNVPSLNVNIRDTKTKLFELVGSGISIGALVRPDGERFRLGARLSTSVGATPKALQGAPSVDIQFARPRRVAVPWTVVVGGAYTLLGDPNLPSCFENSDDCAKMERRYLRAALDVSLVGPSESAIGIDAWVAGDQQRAGESGDIGLRLGVEAEAIADYLRLRLGSYVEPTRFTESKARLHGTFGLDLRLFRFIWAWRLTGAVDVAPRYSNVVLSIGFWR